MSCGFVTLNGLPTLRKFKDDALVKSSMNLSTSIRSWFEHLIQWIKTIFSLKSGLIFLLVVLFSTFVAVMIYETTEKFIGQLLGLSEENEKNKILTFLGIGMGGILLALQAVIANMRAQAMVDAANAQTEANRNTERGQRQERLKNAIEHLGHDSDSVRLGGAYELFHLAQDTENLRQTVLDILCAHIRRTTGEIKYREDYSSKPSEEVQSLLTLLFVQEYKIFKGCHINLQGSWLNGAKLNRARLQGANLVEAYLQRADLREAYLQVARVGGAYLQETKLHGTHLHGADLVEAKLQDSEIMKARLYGANLVKAKLQRADLFDAHLQGSILKFACLQGATLVSTRLQGAILWDASLQGARLNQARLRGIGASDSAMSFTERIRDRIGRESESYIAIFAGGLTQEDVDSLVEGLLNENAKRDLREKLNPHIGKPENKQLPKNSNAITEAYTEEEAEQWIVEYEEAMSEVPKADNGQ